MTHPTGAPLAGTISRSMATSSGKGKSKRADFRSIKPSPALLHRIDKLKLGRVRRSAKTKSAKSRAVAAEATETEVDPYRYASPKDEDSLFQKLNFFASAKSATSFPENRGGVPEVAFAGRSNAGKSTLLNQLTRSAPARVSDKPGFTQTINFYGLGHPLKPSKYSKVLPGAGAYRLVMVDMPGYGFADASPTVVQSWAEMMRAYIEQRHQLRRIFLLLDGRHGLKKIDAEFMAYLDGVKGLKFSCVLTKCDLVPKEDLARRVMQLEQHLRDSTRGTHEVYMVSNRSRESAEHLQKALVAMAKPEPTRGDLAGAVPNPKQ